jgi:hypothetical protein
VRKLHHFKIALLNDGNQTRARGQYRLVLISRPPIWVELWYLTAACRVKVDRKNLPKFFDKKWPNGNGNALQ